MTNHKILALIGAGLLFVGVFMPIVSIPIVGSVNYFMNGQGDGVLLLLLAAVAGALVAAKRVRQVVWPGGLAMLLLVVAFFRFQSGMAGLRAKMGSELAGNPFRGLADAAVSSVQLRWGWAVLIIGAGLLIYAGLAARKLDR